MFLCSVFTWNICPGTCATVCVYCRNVGNLWLDPWHFKYSIINLRLFIFLERINIIIIDHGHSEPLGPFCNQYELQSAEVCRMRSRKKEENLVIDCWLGWRVTQPPNHEGLFTSRRQYRLIANTTAAQGPTDAPSQAKNSFQRSIGCKIPRFWDTDAFQT